MNTDELDRILGRVIQLWDSYCDEKSNLEEYPDIDSFLRHNKVEPVKQKIELYCHKQVIEAYETCQRANNNSEIGREELAEHLNIWIRNTKAELRKTL